MNLRSIVRFGNQSAMHFLPATLILASILSPPLSAQESNTDNAISIRFVLAATANQENNFEGDQAKNAERWIRGFIQNEFNLIERVCHPSEEAAQQLVDRAELEWKTRLSKTLNAYVNSTDPRMAGNFENRIERTVSVWVGEILPEDQKNLWQKEMDTRSAYRKKIVIGRMVLQADRTYGLTASQMVDIDKILREKWKETWWAIYRTGTLPDAKFVWISGVLNESQRTLGTERIIGSNQTESNGFMDVPSLPLNRRFKIGNVTSSPDIPLVTDATKKDSEPDAKKNPK